MNERLRPSGLLTAALQRDRPLTLAALAAVVALAWTYIVHLAHAMGRINATMVMPETQIWGVGEVFWLFIMWTVMMIAMMIPSATPVILLFANIASRRKAQAIPTARPAIFLFGYLLVWAGYSALAAIAQRQLHAAALLSPVAARTTPLLGGALLAAAGIYQWLPLKQRCLTHCRSPVGFFTSEWREGPSGAFLMGVRHGSYCVGCCWLLMALLFVAGVMNLVWVATLSFLVLTEKVAPAGRTFGRAVGILLLSGGVWLLLTGR